MTTTATKADASTNRIRLWPPLVIVLLGAAAIILLQRGHFTLTTRPSFDLNILIWSVELSLCLWALALSGFSPVGRVQLVFVLFAVQSVAYLSVRIDGFAGDGRAILALRWQSAPDELFEQHVPEQLPELRTDVQVRPGEWDVPGFRGVDRDGVIAAPPFEHDWETHPPRELWRRPVGVGWSSFAVVGNHCFTQEQRGEFEAVVCYELTTGQQVWEHRDRAYFQEMTGGNGPRATPTFAEGRLFALGATGILNCLDPTDGTVIWSRNILNDARIMNRLFGMVGSPLVIDGRVIVCPGGPDASMIAYDAASGTPVWSQGSEPASYSSPQLAELPDSRWIMNFNGEGLTAHDADSGQVQWHYPWVSNPSERNNVCQPVVLPGNSGDTARVFVASGYGKGCALLSVHRAAETETFTVEPVWQNRNLKAKFTSVVVHEGFVYGLDERILTCVDIETGERRWKRGRYGHGQVLLVNGVLLVQAETGDVCLVEASPEAFREIARLNALHDRTWNHPVVAGRCLLVRNDREAVCFQLPLTSPE